MTYVPQDAYACSKQTNMLHGFQSIISDLLQGTFSLIIEAWNAESPGNSSTGKFVPAVWLLHSEAATAALLTLLKTTHTHTHIYIFLS